MFNSPILDLVILLSFTYFIGSLMLSAVIEFFSSIFKTRGKSLKIYLEKLLPDKDWADYLPVFIESPHIKSLMDEKGDFPSYIPASSFYMALLDKIGFANLAGSAPETATDPQSWNNAIAASALPESMKNVLSGLLFKAQSDNVFATRNVLPLFEKEVELFFNNAMERASGSYKRTTRKWQWGIALFVAATLNMDTIKIIRESLQDKEKLAKTIDNIAAHMQHIRSTDSTFIIEVDQDTVVIAKTQVIPDSNLIKNDSDVNAAAHKVYKTISTLQIFYNKIDGPVMGYDNCKQFKEEWFGKQQPGSTCDSFKAICSTPAFTCDTSKKRVCDSVTKVCDALKSVSEKPQQGKQQECTIAGNRSKEAPPSLGTIPTFLVKLSGIILTAFALQLGANFWFDWLNRFLNLRAAGKKPESGKLK